MTAKYQGPGVEYKPVPVYFLTNNEVTHQIDVNFAHRVKEKWHRGKDLPGFHALMRKGGLAPVNEFEQFEREGQCSGSIGSLDPTQTYAVQAQCLHVFGDQVWCGYEDLLPVAQQLNFGALVHKAASKATPDFDALTFAAQFSQTVALFKGATYKTAAYAANPRNWFFMKPGMRDSSHSKKLVGGWADAWLIYRYGITPALMDLNAITEIIKGHAGTKTLLVKNAARDNGSLTSEVERVYNDAAVKLTMKRTNTFNISQRSLVSATYRFEKSAMKLNPIATAWEMIPYSFVVDWFVNVGNAIDSMSVVLNSTGNTVSNGSLIQCTSNAHVVTEAQNGYTRSDSLNASCNAFLATRAPASIQLAPTLKNNLNMTRSFDAAALLWKAYESMLKSRRR